MLWLFGIFVGLMGVWWRACGGSFGKKRKREQNNGNETSTQSSVRKKNSNPEAVISVGLNKKLDGTRFRGRDDKNSRQATS